jgi:hypothetical protein
MTGRVSVNYFNFSNNLYSKEFKIVHYGQSFLPLPCSAQGMTARLA